MSRPLVFKQVGAFIWSILPSAPSQALLLVGSTSLFISNSLRWGTRYTHAWYIYSHLLSIPIFVAGVVGYYLCFLQSKKPARILFAGVLLPSLAGLIAFPIVGFHWFLDAVEPMRATLPSIVDSHGWDPIEFLEAAAGLGTGIEFASIGFACAAVFFVLLVSGRATLPVRLTNDSSPSTTDSPCEEKEHRRTMLFVWTMIALMFIPSLPAAVLANVVDLRFHNISQSLGTQFFWLQEFLMSLTILALVLIAIGKEGRKTIPAMVRIPPLKFIAIAAFIPAVIENAWSLTSYFQARIVWSTQGWGKYPPPVLGNFFRLPEVSSLLYLIPALVEEIAWRGYLQPRFIRRYGLMRGIVLVGVVWGAFHFSWDFNWFMTFGGVVTYLGMRIMGAVAMSFVLAWLTIRSKSVLPAAIAHATYNVLAFYPLRQYRIPWSMSILMWATAGYVLLRFFMPPSDPDEQPAIASVPELEPSGV